jgi:Zn-dependent M16 (insulinase) family peptidase
MFLGKLFFLIYNHALQFFSRIYHPSNEKGVHYGKIDDEVLFQLQHL